MIEDFELDDFGDGIETSDQEGPPDFRASVRDGRVTLLPWFNQVFLGGPTRQLGVALDAAGVSLVDLRMTGDGPEREVTVAFQADGDRRRADRAIARWARAVGYRRIWFPDRVEELEGLPALRPARTTCNACGANWGEDSPDFWQIVTTAGFFPTICPLCGGDLPQWTVDFRHRARRPRRTPGRATRSVSPAVDTRERS